MGVSLCRHCVSMSLCHYVTMSLCHYVKVAVSLRCVSPSGYGIISREVPVSKRETWWCRGGVEKSASASFYFGTPQFEPVLFLPAIRYDFRRPDRLYCGFSLFGLTTYIEGRDVLP